MTEAPVAAIDCGTNTVRLLIGRLPDVEVRELRTVRLGEGVDRTGRLSEAALARTFAAVEEYAALIAAHGADRVRFGATSASRDAANADEFVRGVEERLGVTPEVLTGSEEAALSFGGAVRGLGVARLREGPVLVVDVGGGSTEVVLGPADLPSDGSGVHGHSMDVGSVRLHERHVRTLATDSAIGADEAAAITADVEAALDDAVGVHGVDVTSARTVVGVAGTMTTLAAAVLGLTTYDPEAIHGARLPAVDVLAWVDRLVGMTLDERLALPWLPAGRADVIDAGALIVAAVLRRTGVDTLTVSETDILDGLAWSLLES